MTIEEFAAGVQQGEREYLKRIQCESCIPHTTANVKHGTKWRRVDIGGSGRFMINAKGEIYGIKAYGVPNLAHYYGTLDNPSPRAFRYR